MKSPRDDHEGRACGIGGFPVGSGPATLFGSAVYERFEFEGPSRLVAAPEYFGGDLEVEFEGVRGGVHFDGWSAEGRVGRVELGDDFIDASGVSGGLAAGCRVARLDRVALGISANVEIASLDVPISAGRLDVEWVQSDLRFGGAFEPRYDVLYYVAPYAGVGCRYFDGVQRTDSLGFSEIDAWLPFAFFGVELAYRPSNFAQLSLGVEALVGDLQGGAVSLILTF